MKIQNVINVINKVANTIHDMKWLNDARWVLSIMYESYVQPIIRLIRPPALWVYRQYKRAFIKMAFVDGKLSHRRAAVIAVPVLIISTWFVVTTAIPETIDFTADGMGVLTERHRHVYLTGANPVPNSPNEDIFQAKGCSTLPCTADSAMYYHIQPNSVKTLLNLATKGTFYYPEEVEAAIPDQLSECDITIQWWRVRMFKMYNTITEVSCQPVSQGK